MATPPILGSCLILLVVGAGADVASAQSATPNPFDIPPGPRRVDVSGSGGFLLSTDWSDLVLLGRVSPASGALEQVLVRDVVRDPGAVFDGTVTYWEGRLGFRAHAGYSDTCLAVGRSCGDLAALSGRATHIGVTTWSYDIGGAVGLIDYKRGAWAWPYVFVGLGAVTYNLQQTVGPPLTFIEHPPAGGGTGPTVIVRERSNDLLIAVDELGIETKLALNFGVGSDFRVPVGPAGIGVRLELSDHVHESPITLQVRNVSGGFAGENGTIVDFGLVHNLRAAVGVVLQFGR